MNYHPRPHTPADPMRSDECLAPQTIAEFFELLNMLRNSAAAVSAPVRAVAHLDMAIMEVERELRLCRQIGISRS